MLKTESRTRWLAIVVFVDVLLAIGMSASAQQGQIGPQDYEYLIGAASGDAFHIAAGKIAVEKAKDPGVKQFGQKMVDDHTKSLDDLKRIATKKKIEIPNEPGPDQTVVLNYLKNSTSPDWDRDYILLETEEHKMDLDDTKAESNEGKDADIKNAAKGALPGIQDHLAAAEAADRALPK